MPDSTINNSNASVNGTFQSNNPTSTVTANAVSDTTPTFAANVSTVDGSGSVTTSKTDQVSLSNNTFSAPPPGDGFTDDTNPTNTATPGPTDTTAPGPTDTSVQTPGSQVYLGNQTDITTTGSVDVNETTIQGAGTTNTATSGFEIDAVHANGGPGGSVNVNNQQIVGGTSGTQQPVVGATQESVTVDGSSFTTNPTGTAANSAPPDTTGTPTDPTAVTPDNQANAGLTPTTQPDTTSTPVDNTVTTPGSNQTNGFADGTTVTTDDQGNTHLSTTGTNFAVTGDFVKGSDGVYVGTVNGKAYVQNSDGSFSAADDNGKFVQAQNPTPTGGTTTSSDGSVQTPGNNGTPDTNTPTTGEQVNVTDNNTGQSTTGTVVGTTQTTDDHGFKEFITYVYNPILNDVQAVATPANGASPTPS